MDKHYRDLLIRALKGTLDTASRREFDRWISDADNRRIYENALRIWDDVQRRTSAYNPDRDRLWEQLQSRIEVCGTPQRAERPAPKRRWMPILRTAAAVAAGVVVTLFAVRPDLSRTPVPARQEFCAFGGKSLAHLTDGSTVWLQSGSTLAYDSSFGAESRDVKLRGEGFFDIAKDPERPFTVEVEGLRIRVHGTKFNVNTSHEDRTVAVSLVEGSVALDSGNGETRRLHPGEIACYDPATQELNIRRGQRRTGILLGRGQTGLRAAVAGRNLPLPLTLVRHPDRHLPSTRPQLRLHVHPHRRTARSDSAHHEPHQSDRLHLLGQPLGVHLRDRIKP